MHPAKATPELAASRILIMEDEEDNVRALAQMLRWAGYDRLELTSDPFEGLRLKRSLRWLGAPIRSRKGAAGLLRARWRGRSHAILQARNNPPPESGFRDAGRGRWERL